MVLAAIHPHLFHIENKHILDVYLDVYMFLYYNFDICMMLRSRAPDGMGWAKKNEPMGFFIFFGPAHDGLGFNFAAQPTP
jgi:hypothetical protein